ncbi:HAD family hydrolase [Burkholderia sp. Se-20378]|uniref:HAD family hydrolase n=1 Tax=Burkholderia sp. Se-20378 TaxID=2703899 RepID=UPI0027DAE9B0|nr:HAD family hydrolase [Burkholderia sp. Se-20378]
MRTEDDGGWGFSRRAIVRTLFNGCAETGAFATSPLQRGWPALDNPLRRANESSSPGAHKRDFQGSTVGNVIVAKMTIDTIRAATWRLSANRILSRLRERWSASVPDASNAIQGNSVIKAIFFDYDGVLTTDRTGSVTTIRYLSEQSGVEYDILRNAFARHNADLLLGKTTHKAIWRAVCESARHELDFGWLEAAFLSTPANAGMFDLARRLEPFYALGIITDNKKDRIDCLRKAQRLDDLFDPIVVSAERGSGKEGAAVFEYALGCLDVKPEEAIFIDNTSENLIVPRQLGMHAILHDDSRNDIDGLIATLTTEFDLRLS